jgi:NAD(P)-dependent dehydrogenase (short-subunit alcohol dehydrogenase family)
MWESLQNKVVIVAGGSAGIGLATAELFAKAGANVVIAARGAKRGREAEQKIKQSGGKAFFVQTDVSKAAQVQDLVGRTVETFGRLDCAVNNAAVAGRIARVGDYTEGEFDAEVSANLKSVWLCMKYELEQMEKQSPIGGVIVNTSSVNGLGGAAMAGLYSMSKSGILALTKSAAQEYAAKKIRVNGLVAGGFDTELLRGAVSRMVDGDEERIRKTFDGFAAQVPAGRIGEPTEAAEAVVWLCSNAASYVTGHSMIVDGGLTAWAR